MWLIVIAFLAFGCNLSTDYLSLQETRWVLERSRTVGGCRSLLGWFFIDLMATAIVFPLGMVVSSSMIWVFIWAFLIWTSTYFPMGLYLELLFGRIILLPYLLTTFFPSAFWLSYVASVLGVKALRRNSRVLRAVLGTIAESRAPARATAGFLTGFLAFGYGLVAAVAWTVG